MRDLPRAEEFYCGLLGLEVGLRVEERGMVFLRVAGRAGILVLPRDEGALHGARMATGLGMMGVCHWRTHHRQHP